MARQRQGRERAMASRPVTTEQVIPEIGSAGAVFTNETVVEPRFTYAEVTSNYVRQSEMPVTERQENEQQATGHWTLTENEVVPEIKLTSAVFTNDSMVEPRFTYAEVTSNYVRQSEMPVTERQENEQQAAGHWTLTENEVVPEIKLTSAVFTNDSMVEPRITYAEVTTNYVRQSEIPLTEQQENEQQAFEHWTLTENEENNLVDRGIPQRMLDAFFFILSLTDILDNAIENFKPSDQSLFSLGMRMERIRLNEESSRPITPPPPTLPLPMPLSISLRAMSPRQPAPSPPPWPLEIDSQRIQDDLVDHAIRRLKGIWSTDPKESSGNVWGTDNVRNVCPVPDRTEELLEQSGIRRTVCVSEDVQDTYTTDMTMALLNKPVVEYYRRRANRRPLFDRMIHTEEQTTKSNVISSVPGVRATLSQSANVQSTAPRHNNNRPRVSFYQHAQRPPFHQNRQPINYTPVNTMGMVIPRNYNPISFPNNNFYHINNSMQYVDPRMFHVHSNQYNQGFIPSIRLDTRFGPQQTNIYPPPPPYNYNYYNTGHNNTHAINNIYNHQYTWSPQMYTGFASQPPWSYTQHHQPTAFYQDSTIHDECQQLYNHNYQAWPMNNWRRRSNRNRNNEQRSI